MQVKQYNAEIAAEKERKALVLWREKDNGYGYPVPNMFYFFKTDRRGHSIEKRKNGYVAFDEHNACFHMNPIKAIAMFRS
ncbi:MAG: hypothetical protein ABIJ16_09415 [Bacteroidota bacterium]